MHKELIIGGTAYPYKLTLGAQRRFDERFKDEGVSVLHWAKVIDRIEVKHLIALHYEGVKAGCAQAGVAFTMTEEAFADGITMDDLTTLSEVVDSQPDTLDAEKKT
jgi:hypothetical protein